jgi:hypothetical protein
MLLAIVWSGAPFLATASCKYRGISVANLYPGSLKNLFQPAGGFFRPTLTPILYHTMLWVKKIITQYIVVLSEFMPVRGTYLRSLTVFFVKLGSGHLN